MKANFAGRIEHDDVETVYRRSFGITTISPMPDYRGKLKSELVHHEFPLREEWIPAEALIE